MPTKATFYFNQLQSGFSETYYHPSNTPRALAESLANAFFQRAAVFRSVDTILKAVRFSSTVPPRESFLVRPYPICKGTSTSTLDPGPEVISTTGVYLLQATTGGERRVFMRGLADCDVKRDVFGNDTPSANLTTGTNNFFLAMNIAGFSIRVGQRPPAGGLIWSDVPGLLSTNGAPDQYTFFRLSIPNQAFVKGDIVLFNGVPEELRNFPRSAVITSVNVIDTVTQYQIQYALPGGVLVNPPKMRVTKVAYGYNLITGWQFERFSEHKTGRPFGSLRGRARAR